MIRIESVDGLFHEGNPASGQKGTKVTAAWLNAVQEAAIGVSGDIITADDETTLTEADGVLFANPADGATELYHLPVYATVGALKSYRIENIGEGVASINAVDGKTIAGAETLLLAPGDRCEITKDGTNWQTTPVNATGPWGVNVARFGTLAAAVASAVTAGKTIVVTDVMDCIDLTIPATRGVEVRLGGRIRYSGDLVIEGPFNAGLYQCLEKVGAGTLSGLKRIRPEWLGAKGDAVTDDSAVFTEIEATVSIKKVDLAEGRNYKTTLASLSKYYVGQGAIQFAAGRAVSGLGSKELQRSTTGLEGINAPISTSLPRCIVFIGDSITYGAGCGPTENYPYVIKQFINNSAPFHQSSYLSGGVFDRSNQVIVGAATYGDKGPLHRSLILPVGGTITFPADFVDFIGVWCQRAVGSGSIEVRAAGVLVNTINCSGAAANDVFSGNGPYMRGGAAVSYELKAITAPVELTGIYASHYVAGNTPFIQVHAHSGYATADFTSAAVLASIVAQTIYAGAAPIYVLALGTNDIFNGDVAVSSAIFKANLLTIVNALLVAGIPVLTVPTRGTEIVHHPILEPFDNYRLAVYEVARQTGVKVVDFGELDLATLGAFIADGLHPDNKGHKIIADHLHTTLALGGATYLNPAFFENLALSGGAVNYAVAGYGVAACSVRSKGQVELKGAIDVTGVAALTVIAAIPIAAIPLTNKVVTVPAWNPANGIGSAVLVLQTDGFMKLLGITAGCIYLSLDAVTYSIYN